MCVCRRAGLAKVGYSPLWSEAWLSIEWEDARGKTWRLCGCRSADRGRIAEGRERVRAGRGEDTTVGCKKKGGREAGRQAQEVS